MELVLASTSPARLALLRAAGVEPVVVPSFIDEKAAVAIEEAATGAHVPADRVVALLAEAKAMAVHRELGESHPDALVLGGDSVFEVAGTVHGKPHTAAAATARWVAQRGATGVLHSGHHLIHRRSGRSAGAVATASVSFAPDVSDLEIERYVATGEPLEVAGAFTLDARGGPFIERVEGDPSTVVGLSLATVRRLVRSLGVEWTDLWS